MSVTNLNELFLHELKDVYDAEHQLVEALPKLAEAATTPELAEAFQNHLEETRGHLTRLEAVFESCGATPERETCKGMKGLIAEGEKMIKEIDDPVTLDAALISAAQRAEPYEIAAYGTLRVWAMTTGLRDAEDELEAILGEEKAANDKLTEIAESGVNSGAEAGEAGRIEGKTVTHRKTTSGSRPARSRRTTKTTR